MEHVHPDVFLDYLHDFCNLKHNKAYQKRYDNEEETWHQKQSLLKAVMVDVGMSTQAAAWFYQLTRANKALPLEYHVLLYIQDGFRRTLMDLFREEFGIRPMSEFYRDNLAKMAREVITATSPEKISDLLLRLMRTNTLFTACSDLPVSAYINAFLEPLRVHGGYPIARLLWDYASCNTVEWPAFRRKANEIIQNYNRLEQSSAIPITVDPSVKKVQYASEPRYDQRDKARYRDSTYRSRVNAVQGLQDNDGEDDRDEPRPSSIQASLQELMDKQEQLMDRQEQARQQDRKADREDVNSMINALKKSLKSKVTAAAPSMPPPPPPPSYHGGGGGYAHGGYAHQAPYQPINSMQDLDILLRSKINALQEERTNSSGSQSHGKGQKRVRMNSMTSQEGDRRRKDSRSGRDSTSLVPPYLYNPKGNEAWMRWLRVCLRCGCWVGHFYRNCHGHPRPGYDPNQDPKAAVPIEDYPATRELTLQRCKAELREYGKNLIRWNCSFADAPTEHELGL